jgi:hypothetical protein
MKRSWLFILVSVVLGIEVVLLGSAKHIVDKAEEEMPLVQQESIQPVPPAATAKADESVPTKSLVKEIKDYGRNEIHFDFVMPDFKPDVPDILSQRLSFLRAHPDFQYCIKRTTGEGGMVEKKLTCKPLGERIEQVYLVHRGIEQGLASSIHYEEVNHD